MQRAVAHRLRSVQGAEIANELGLAALLLEEAKLDRGGGDKIRRRIQIGDHEPVHQICSLRIISDPAWRRSWRAWAAAARMSRARSCPFLRRSPDRASDDAWRKRRRRRDPSPSP